MDKFDVLSIPLDDNDAFHFVGKVASDEFGCDEMYDCVFFFGRLVDDGFMHEPLVNEEKFYTTCPYCNKLIELDREPIHGEDYICPLCGAEGVLYDYHDPEFTVDEENKHFYGFLEKLDKGYVLRLFDVCLEYERELDNYVKFDYSTLLLITEVGREYWYEGKTSYYTNIAGMYEDPKFKAVNTLIDGEYYIVNYDNEFDHYDGSCRIEDILYDIPIAQTFIESVSKRTTYSTFNTLSKYGFVRLTYDMLYIPHIFGDSNKISEVLQLDYNKVRAYASAADIDADCILAMRELQRFDLDFSINNMDIMRVFMKSATVDILSYKVKKTFKYLRNQMSRSGSKGEHIPRDYCDYIADCLKLGLDTHSEVIRFPTDLNKAHTRTSALVKIEASRAVDERIREVYERCREFCEYSDDVYCIVMPSSSEQIIHEGKEQSHCVGGYAERMANGEDIILFLRKVAEPDKSYYTVEIRPNMKKLELVQCRGNRNCDKTAAIDKFLLRYTKWFNSRKCDIRLSSRRKYYKAVYKNQDGRYISYWDNKTEYRIGETIETCMDANPDMVAVKGIHIASLEFAKNYGDKRDNAAILEIEDDMCDVVIPDAKDQLRAKRGKVLREVPMSELGDWGVRHSQEIPCSRCGG